MTDKANLIHGKFLTGVSSVVGDTRRQYEDRARIAELRTAKGLDLFVTIVADGVGSADNGGLAAQLSIDAAISYMTDSEETDIALMITNALKYANYVVYKDVITRDVDASTTLLIGVFYKDRFFVGNVGDSRAYWIQESGKVIQLTMDHSYYNIKGGDPNSSQAEALVNAVGIRKDIYADIGLYVKDKDRKQAARVGTQGLPLKIGDTILLCSDGLIKDDLKGERFVRDEEIIQALRSEVQTNAAAVKMTGLAEGRYVDDNVSVITVQYTTPDRIENVLKKQERKRLTQKLVYTGLGLLVLAGIVTGAFLLNANRKASQKLDEIANAPTQTPIIYTPEATPTPTALVIIEAGKLFISDVGQYTPEDGYQKFQTYGNDSPLWAYQNSTDPAQKIYVGTMLDANVKIETFDDVGVMLTLGTQDFNGASVGNNDLFVYGNSSLTLRNEQGVTDMSLTQGALYINLEGRSEIANLIFPSHDNAQVRIIGGSMLVTLQPDSITMWCLREDCDFETEQTDQRLRDQQIRVYHLASKTIDEPESYAPPSTRYEEYVKWNNKCNQCMPYDKVPSPTPTPMPFTSTDQLGGGNTPEPTAKEPTQIVPTQRAPTRTSTPTRTKVTVTKNTPTPVLTEVTPEPPIEETLQPPPEESPDLPTQEPSQPPIEEPSLPPPQPPKPPSD